MKLRSILLAAGVALMGGMVSMPAAHAQRVPITQRGRRGELQTRVDRIRDRVQLAWDRGEIGRGTFNDLNRRLDSVQDFLSGDRHLVPSEFDRRSDDLNDISRDLERSMR